LIAELLKIEQLFLQEKESNDKRFVKQKNGFQNIDGQIFLKNVLYTFFLTQIILFLTQVIIILMKL